MTAQTDAQLHAEAERRSVPVVPEATLYDAVWWLTHDALVPADHISGIVDQGNVYEVETVRVEWAWCACFDGEHRVSPARWGNGRDGQEAARAVNFDGVHVLRRVVAATAVEVAR